MKKTLIAASAFFLMTVASKAQISNGTGGGASILANSPSTNLNVGIGNSNPLVPLHLGTATKAGNVFIDGNFLPPSDPNRIPSSLFLNSTGWGITAKSFGTHDNDMFLFTSVPDQVFPPPGRLETNDIRFGTKTFYPNAYPPQPPTEKTNMIIKEKGEVGIGIIKPWAQFQVMGNRTNDFAVFSNSNKNIVAEAALLFGSYSKPQNMETNPMLLQLYGNTNLGNGVVDAYDRFRVFNNGQVVIGNVPIVEGYRLFVQQGIITEKLKVAVSTTSNWSDYVFSPNYRLMSLEKLDKFIKVNKHLPNVPSAQEVVKSGIDVAKMDATLLAKIEELTLYMIQLKSENEKLKARVNKLESKK